MKILVTGVNGQLGHDVMRELLNRGHVGMGSGSSSSYNGIVHSDIPYVQMDITDKTSVDSVMASFAPDAVVHCAAWTAVDAAEEPENYNKVMALNAEGARNIARACKKQKSKMLYLSTDYVFDGGGSEHWRPDCHDYRPLNVYGESKLRGELAVSELLVDFYIVRTAWVFGANGKNFVKTMLGLGASHDTLRVVNDQIGSPTYTVDLARLLVDMLETDKFGYYHATNEGDYISWAAFAAEIFRQSGMNTRVIPVSTAEYGISKAKRPFNSRLDKAKLAEKGFAPLPEWKDALSRYLDELECSYGTDKSNQT